MTLFTKEVQNAICQSGWYVRQEFDGTIAELAKDTGTATIVVVVPTCNTAARLLQKAKLRPELLPLAEAVKQAEAREYRYGMRLRPFSIGCQPMEGLKRCEDDPKGKYWDVLIYNRELSDNELAEYELDFIG